MDFQFGGLKIERPPIPQKVHFRRVRHFPPTFQQQKDRSALQSFNSERLFKLQKYQSPQPGRLLKIVSASGITNKHGNDSSEVMVLWGLAMVIQVCLQTVCQVCMHTYSTVQYITLHCIALHYIELQYITVHTYKHIASMYIQ